MCCFRFDCRFSRGLPSGFITRRSVRRLASLFLTSVLFVWLQYSLCNESLIELSNSGASGSLFYVSSDDEFIIKTVQHKEAEFLQKLLPGYFMVRFVEWLYVQDGICREKKLWTESYSIYSCTLIPQIQSILDRTCAVTI